MSKKKIASGEWGLVDVHSYNSILHDSTVTPSIHETCVIEKIRRFVEMPNLHYYWRQDLESNRWTLNLSNSLNGSQPKRRVQSVFRFDYEN